MDEAKIIAETELWVREAVLGLDLCPFAASALQRGGVGYRVCSETRPEAIFRALVEEVLAFVEAPAEAIETELWIVPEGLLHFDDYLDVLYAAEQALEHLDLAGKVQLASFHPRYRFQDAPADDPAHYTNRSPHPIFHLLREAVLERALAHYPEPESIPQRNMERLRQMGLDALERRLARITRED
jgi:hypothetical protein